MTPENVALENTLKSTPESTLGSTLEGTLGGTLDLESTDRSPREHAGAHPHPLDMLDTICVTSRIMFNNSSSVGFWPIALITPSSSM